MSSLHLNVIYPKRLFFAFFEEDTCSDPTPEAPSKEVTTSRVTVSAACLLILIELLEREITLLNNSMIDATGTMDVPMRQFFFGSARTSTTSTSNRRSPTPSGD